MVEVSGGRLDPQEVRRKFLIETGYHFQNKVKQRVSTYLKKKFYKWKKLLSVNLWKELVPHNT